MTIRTVFHAVKTGKFMIPIDSPYFDYKLCGSKKYIHIMILIAGFINIILLVPDLTLIIDGTSRFSIAIIRIVFSLILFGMGFRIKTIHTFRLLSAYFTVCELLSILVFLYVYSQYSRPNFMIQSMGIIIIIIVIFFVPNRWIYMLITAVFGSVGFFIATFIFMKSIDTMDFWAAVVYIFFALLICALSAWSAEQHQFREFLAKRELERLSSTDFLTNTANRYKMEEEAARWIDFCRRQKFPLCLVFLDVDNLKTINDRYGHPAGDSVLEQLASLIQSQLRKSDIIARWGGDEFILLLPNITLQDAISIIERARNSIQKNIFERDIRVTCSFGVVEMKENSTFETMIDGADKLMYISKASGKNMIQWEQ